MDGRRKNINNMKKHLVRVSILILIIIVVLNSGYVYKCFRLYEAKQILSGMINEENIENIRLTIKKVPSTVLYSAGLSVDEMAESDSSDGIEVIVVDGEKLAENIYLFEKIRQTKLKPLRKESHSQMISTYYLLENKKTDESFEVAMFGINGENLGGVYINGIEVNYDECLTDVIQPYAPF